MLYNYLFDAIIWDPPYGWRAGVIKAGLSTNKKEKRLEQIRNKNKYNENEDKEDNNKEEEKETNEKIL